MIHKSIRLPQQPAFARSTCSYIIISTYQLDGVDSRIGSIYILSHNLDIIRSITAPSGVFRFELVDSHVVISAVTDGSLFITSLSDEPSFNSLAISEDFILDVSSPSASNKLVCTDNTGLAYLIDLPTGTKVSKWKAHSLPYSDLGCEVWTCALNGNLVCTGGEDATLKIWDVRHQSIIQRHTEFGAGVTFSEWEDDHFVVTGCYDQHVRLFDTRSRLGPLKVSETTGGVWHMENCERTHVQIQRYLAACMYGGWALFDKNLKCVLLEENAGQQLLYGATMISENSIVYTSFNDCTVTINTL